MRFTFTQILKVFILRTINKIINYNDKCRPWPCTTDYWIFVLLSNDLKKYNSDKTFKKENKNVYMNNFHPITSLA